MADIGATLREKRIREKIDVTTVESATKIRAKYLRALEHEEWSILPGPAYAKSFLRTYAEYLGLDAHMLVEQYKTQFERPEELELPAFAKEPMGGRVRPPRPPSRGALVAGAVLAVLAVLFILGITGDDEGGNGSRRTAARTETAQQTAAARERARAARRQAAARPSEVAVAVVATRSVWVCLIDESGKPVIGGRILAAGDREGPFRSKRFEVTLGNGGGDLRVNGKPREIPDSSVPLGYVVTPVGTRPLPASRRPTCAPGETGAAANTRAETSAQ